MPVKGGGSMNKDQLVGTAIMLASIAGILVYGWILSSPSGPSSYSSSRASLL
ncbi:hypothetical protein [Thermofilum pendens]